MLMNLGPLDSLEKPELIYVSKDLTVFYYLMFPKAAAFKFFVWTKTQMKFERMKETKFNLEQQAAFGFKFMPGELDQAGASYKLYGNDFYVGNNTIIAKAGDLRLLYVNHAAINFMHTACKEFVGYNEEFMNNLVRKSTLISEVGERTRTRFFHLIHERISLYSSSRN